MKKEENYHKAFILFIPKSLIKKEKRNSLKTPLYWQEKIIKNAAAY